MHHAPHADDLLAALADVLRDPLDDVFAVERIAVHSRGLERWLAQRLSHTVGTRDGEVDGVSIGIDFPFPGRLVHDALANAVHPELDPAVDPWRADRLVWHLLALLHARPTLADGTPLAGHLLPPDGDEPDRRFGAVRTLATLFDRYAVHRPGLLQAWARGPRASAVTADGRPLPAIHAWQAGVWRALRDTIVEDTGIDSPPERLEPAMRALADDPRLTDLPARVSLFGLTALPTSHLDVLGALARHRDVHLFLLHPSPGLWRRMLPALARTATTGPTRREDDPVGDVVSHPLVEGWARDAREMQVVLAGRGITLPADPVGPAAVVTAPRGAAARTASVPATLLARLQADVRADAPPPAAAGASPDPRMPLDPADRSIQFHACHGRARQVEVLRDVLLHAFAADPSLQPRDVLVLCPDPEAVAPLLEATFASDDDPETTGDADGAGSSSRAADTSRPGDAARLRAGDLRLRIADRPLGRTNPLVRLATQLLDLADARLTASEVRDLLEREPIRTTFGLDAADSERLDGWIADLGVRWGLDGADRERVGIPTDAGTWRRSFDRLLLGVAVADDDRHTVGGLVPFDDVTTSDIDLAGRAAELLARLGHGLGELRAPRPLEDWVDALRRVVDALATTAPTDAWQRVQFEHGLGELVRAATGPSGVCCPVPLALPEFRAVLRGALEGGASGASHRTGGLTVCGMVPMRSVPHRVVVLLGMDDGAVPRSGRADGDDLLAADPHVGDRDPRTEDRQVLLDAVLAARERLVVLYTGRDERSNQPCPPAVPIGELLDVIDRTAVVATDRGAGVDPPRHASSHLTVHHPLHATDQRNFTPGALGVPGQPFASDTADLGGARALAGARDPLPRPFLRSPLPAPDVAGVLELDDLVRCVAAPVPTLLSERFGLHDDRDDRSRDDELPLELAGLDRWRVGDRLLRLLLDATELDRALALERGRDTVPPGELAVPALGRLTADLDGLIGLAGEHDVLGETAVPIQVDVTVGGGRRLVGAVDDLVGVTIRDVRYARLAERARLCAWVRLLALSATQPATPWRAVTLGRERHRARKGSTASASILGPLGSSPEQRNALALEHLAWLVELRDTALCEPVPLATTTSGRYACAVLELRTGRSRLSGATRQGASAWDSNDHVSGEADDPAHLLVHGGAVPFTSLLEEVPRPDERQPPWDLAEPSRFGRWALRLWSPLYAAETLVDR